ncbi:MAG TPA: tyrosine--tRNA ligase [Longimicrobiales bacterium]|nr:tyrosine--tRNA ligase [Longimicrobiales bacterium]
MDLISELEWRGLLFDATEGAGEHLGEGKRSGYVGFDPTAASLHVGHLLPIMGRVHLQRCGHTPVAVAGGGTGLIGDPSGKTQERQLLTREQVEANVASIRGQLEHFLDFEAKANPARVVNNLDWLGSVRFIDFLRDVGKHFSVNAMLRKESVRRRIEAEETGISYTEFSYMLLQAYDFLQLHDTLGVTLQMGGSDQWGNITAGIDLVRRERGVPAHGIVLPLITTASGVKFGKTEAGAVWLDPERTSPYRFYQFWLNQDDADAARYLRYFTLLPRGAIEELDAALAERPQEREAQRTLAREVTRAVHGPEGLRRAQEATQALFGGELSGLSGGEIEDIFADVPSSELPRTELEGEGKALVDLLAEGGVASSKSDARRSLEQGGIYLNAVRVDDDARRITAADALHGRFLVLRKGKKSYHLVRLLS